jgi:hypothetical protein
MYNINLIIGILAFATAVIGYMETRYRMSSLSMKVKAEVKAEATLAAAVVLADALVAAARIKSEAVVAKEKL